MQTLDREIDLATAARKGKKVERARTRRRRYQRLLAHASEPSDKSTDRFEFEAVERALHM